MNKIVEKAVRTMRALPDKEATLAAQIVLDVAAQPHGLERLEAIADKARRRAEKDGLGEAELDAIVKHG